MADYKDLIVWKKAMNMVVHLYEISTNFPKEEKYGLTSQMRRAGVSVPSNIAEGKCREGDKEFHRFLTIADGSLAELKTQIEIAWRVKYLRADQYDSLMKECDLIGKLLGGLIIATRE